MNEQLAEIRRLIMAWESAKISSGDVLVAILDLLNDEPTAKAEDRS